MLCTATIVGVSQNRGVGITGKLRHQRKIRGVFWSTLGGVRRLGNGQQEGRILLSLDGPNVLKLVATDSLASCEPCSYPCWNIAKTATRKVVVWTDRVHISKRATCHPVWMDFPWQRWCCQWGDFGVLQVSCAPLVLTCGTKKGLNFSIVDIPLCHSYDKVS